jgi:nuclear pore complex protein Nup133
MDVDSVVSDRSFIQRPSVETVFAKSDELSVSFYANLPVEVKQILKNAGWSFVS